jgi:hypothetical protein
MRKLQLDNVILGIAWALLILVVTFYPAKASNNRPIEHPSSTAAWNVMQRFSLRVHHHVTVNDMKYVIVTPRVFSVKEFYCWQRIEHERDRNAHIYGYDVRFEYRKTVYDYHINTDFDKIVDCPMRWK